MRRTKYALGFKDEAVKQVIDRGHPVVDVAKPLGISESVLYTWVSKFEKADDAPGCGSPGRCSASSHSEVPAFSSPASKPCT